MLHLYFYRTWLNFCAVMRRGWYFPRTDSLIYPTMQKQKPLPVMSAQLEMCIVITDFQTLCCKPQCCHCCTKQNMYNLLLLQLFALNVTREGIFQKLPLQKGHFLHASSCLVIQISVQHYLWIKKNIYRWKNLSLPSNIDLEISLNPALYLIENFHTTPWRLHSHHTKSYVVLDWRII